MTSSHLRRKGFQTRRGSNTAPVIHVLRRLLLNSEPLYIALHYWYRPLMEEVDVEPAVTVSKLYELVFFPSRLNDFASGMLAITLNQNYYLMKLY